MLGPDLLHELLELSLVSIDLLFKHSGTVLQVPSYVTHLLCPSLTDFASTPERAGRLHARRLEPAGRRTRQVITPGPASGRDRKNIITIRLSPCLGFTVSPSIGEQKRSRNAMQKLSPQQGDASAVILAKAYPPPLVTS